MPYRIGGLVLTADLVTKLADQLEPNRRNPQFWHNGFSVVRREVKKYGYSLSAPEDTVDPEPWVVISTRMSFSRAYNADSIKPYKEGKREAAVRERLKRYGIEDLKFGTFISHRTLILHITTPYLFNHFVQIIDSCVESQLGARYPMSST